MALTERPHDFCYSKNEIRYVFTLTDLERTGLFLQVKILYAKTDDIDFTELYTFEGFKPAADGTVYVPIQRYIDSVLNHVMPDIGITATNASDQCCRFYVHFREIDDADPDTDWIETESAFERIAIKGGIEKNKASRNNIFINYFDVAKPFLTWQPSKRFIFRDELVYLSYLNKTLTGFKVKVSMKAIDGTTMDVTFDHSAKTKRLYHLLVSPAALALETTLAKPLYYYEVSIVNTSTIPTEILIPFQGNQTDARAAFSLSGTPRAGEVLNVHYSFNANEVDPPLSFDSSTTVLEGWNIDDVLDDLFSKIVANNINATQSTIDGNGAIQIRGFSEASVEVTITPTEGFINIITPYRFYVEYRPCYEYYDLVYHNSLGGIDSVRVVGDTAKGFERSTDDADGGPDVNSWNAKTKPYEKSFSNISITRRYKGNIGILKTRTKEEQEAYAELLVTKSIYMMRPDWWVPVINIQTSLDLGSRKNISEGFTIEWQLSDANDVYTPSGKNFGLGAI